MANKAAKRERKAAEATIQAKIDELLTCRVRGCDQEIGTSRSYCAEHVPRELTEGERRLIGGTWFLFTAPRDSKEGIGYEVLATTRSSKELARFKEVIPTSTTEAGRR